MVMCGHECRKHTCFKKQDACSEAHNRGPNLRSHSGNPTLPVGCALSMGGSTVLIMDCNTKCEGLTAQLHCSSKYGLYDVLSGGVSLVSCIQDTAFTRLSVLPFGRCVRSSSALFASRRFQQALAAAQNAFQYVIIDTPSIQDAADAAVLASIADATIVVVGWDQVTSRELQAAIQQLCDAEARVIGTFINRYDARLERNAVIPDARASCSPSLPIGQAVAGATSSSPSTSRRD